MVLIFLFKLNGDLTWALVEMPSDLESVVGDREESAGENRFSWEVKVNL